MKYRRYVDAQTWHFSEKCSQWPRNFDVIASQELRDDFEICAECIALGQQESKPDGD